MLWFGAAMREWRLAIALPLLSGVHAGAFTASEATAQSFDDLVGGVHHALVEFYAPWCDACSAFAPVLDADGQRVLAAGRRTRPGRGGEASAERLPVVCH